MMEAPTLRPAHESRRAFRRSMESQRSKNWGMGLPSRSAASPRSSRFPSSSQVGRRMGVRLGLVQTGSLSEDRRPVLAWVGSSMQPSTERASFRPRRFARAGSCISLRSAGVENVWRSWPRTMQSPIFSSSVGDGTYSKELRIAYTQMTRSSAQSSDRSSVYGRKFYHLFYIKDNTKFDFCQICGPMKSAPRPAILG